MTALPMTGFHRTQISLHGKQYFRNTATFGILPCLLAISDSRGTVNIRQIPSVSGILTRFPCSANKHACPIARVAHLPQKPRYVILGTIAVGFGGSAFALRLGFSAVVSIPAKAGETLQKVCPSIRCANWDQNHSETLSKEFPLFSPKTGTTPLKRPLLPCYLADKRSLVFSIYSVSVYAKITFLFK